MDIYRTSDCLDVKKASLLRSTVDEADMTGSLFTKVRMANLTVQMVDFSNSTFETSSFRGSVFKKVDLRDITLDGCDLDGATIDGIKITDLLAAYRATL